jgi:hypothetical protein
VARGAPIRAAGVMVPDIIAIAWAAIVGRRDGIMSNRTNARDPRGIVR